MKAKPLALKLFLDEGVPVSAGKALEARGHEVVYFNQSGVTKGAADDLVCIAAEANEAILVAHDSDMKTLARGHGLTGARFKTLSLLKLDCRESNDAARINEAMSLIEHEWLAGNGRERRLYVVVGEHIIRTHR